MSRIVVLLNKKECELLASIKGTKTWREWMLDKAGIPYRKIKMGRPRRKK